MTFILLIELFKKTSLKQFINCNYVKEITYLHCETMLQGVRKISRHDRSGLFRREIIRYFIQLP